jgi:hypothetical protein
MCIGAFRMKWALRSFEPTALGDYGGKGSGDGWIGCSAGNLEIRNGFGCWFAGAECDVLRYCSVDGGIGGVGGFGGRGGAGGFGGVGTVREVLRSSMLP